MTVRGSIYHTNKKTLRAAIDYAAQITGVVSYQNRLYGKLSGGQKRRADIARALVNTPKILFLDEPTTGLDPQTRQNVWEAIEQLRKEKNMTIFLTTHYMEEAARADYVIVLDNGLTAAKGTPAQLREQYSSDYLILHTDDTEKVVQILTSIGKRFEVKNDIVSVQLDHTMHALPLLEKCRNIIRGFQVIEGNMDDAFIQITGRKIRE